jgi:hypothetical protein
MNEGKPKETRKSKKIRIGKIIMVWVGLIPKSSYVGGMVPCVAMREVVVPLSSEPTAR